MWNAKYVRASGLQTRPWKWNSRARILRMCLIFQSLEALELFESIPRIKQVLQTLNDVGLGYIRLGQAATTLSGGEAQRVKLASELCKPATGRTFYILDEPTTGLHFADVDKLLQVLQRLVDRGNTVLVIEHNLDVVKSADYIIDLGPDGGDKGGQVIFAGTPEDIITHPQLTHGAVLKQFLNRDSALFSSTKHRQK